MVIQIYIKRKTNKTYISTVEKFAIYFL